MSFRPYGQKVTGLVSNGIDLICFCVNGKKERKDEQNHLDLENNFLQCTLPFEKKSVNIGSKRRISRNK